MVLFVFICLHFVQKQVLILLPYSRMFIKTYKKEFNQRDLAQLTKAEFQFKHGADRNKQF